MKRMMFCGLVLMFSASLAVAEEGRSIRSLRSLLAPALFGQTDLVPMPAPLSPAEAERLLRSLKSSARFDGFRGARRIDLAPLAALVSRLSQVAAAGRGRISELELNPVIVHADGSGLTIADALIRLV